MGRGSLRILAFFEAMFVRAPTLPLPTLTAKLIKSIEFPFERLMFCAAEVVAPVMLRNCCRETWAVVAVLKFCCCSTYSIATRPKSSICCDAANDAVDVAEVEAVVADVAAAVVDAVGLIVVLPRVTVTEGAAVVLPRLTVTGGAVVEPSRSMVTLLPVEAAAAAAAVLVPPNPTVTVLALIVVLPNWTVTLFAAAFAVLVPANAIVSLEVAAWPPPPAMLSVISTPPAIEMPTLTASTTGKTAEPELDDTALRSLAPSNVTRAF